MPALANVFERLHDVICCPRCAGDLRATASAVLCSSCGQEWERPGGAGYLDLRPSGSTAHSPGWAIRQQETCGYYASLMEAPAEAVLGFRSDLAPFAALLAQCSGRVLDVGGGHGLVRTYLPPNASYVSVDPSVDWLDRRWDALASEFPCLDDPLAFIQGLAEHLPFRDDVCDNVMCLWSLNHSAVPERALREMCRVLKPSGRLFLILEDGEPTWRELLAGRGAHYLVPGRARLLLAKALAPLRGWPVQPDHLAIRHTSLVRWTSSGLLLRRRFWVGCYLALEYTRQPGGFKFRSWLRSAYARFHHERPGR